MVTKSCLSHPLSIAGIWGGLAGADANCQAAATSAGLPGTYKAWLSDSTTSASARLTHYTGPYYTPPGGVNHVEVASNWAGLTSGAIEWPIFIDEHGVRSLTHYAWTNTSPAGAAVHTESDESCQDWTDDRQDAASVYGSVASTNANWTEFKGGEQNLCWTASALYCIQQ